MSKDPAGEKRIGISLNSLKQQSKRIGRRIRRDFEQLRREEFVWGQELKRIRAVTLSWTSGWLLLEQYSHIWQRGRAIGNMIKLPFKEKMKEIVGWDLDEELVSCSSVQSKGASDSWSSPDMLDRDEEARARTEIFWKDDEKRTPPVTWWGSWFEETREGDDVNSGDSKEVSFASSCGVGAGVGICRLSHNFIFKSENDLRRGFSLVPIISARQWAHYSAGKVLLPEKIRSVDSGNITTGIETTDRTEGSLIVKDFSSELMIMIPPAPELTAFMTARDELHQKESDVSQGTFGNEGAGPPLHNPQRRIRITSLP
jgi:hypothetical protein